MDFDLSLYHRCFKGQKKVTSVDKKYILVSVKKSECERCFLESLTIEKSPSLFWHSRPDTCLVWWFQLYYNRLNYCFQPSGTLKIIVVMPISQFSYFGRTELFLMNVRAGSNLRWLKPILLHRGLRESEHQAGRSNQSAVNSEHPKLKTQSLTHQLFEQSQKASHHGKFKWTRSRKGW